MTAPERPEQPALNSARPAGYLRRFWQWWLRTAEVIGNFQSRVVLTLFYAIIVMPFGICVRLFSDRLRLRGHRSSAWTPIQGRATTVEQLKQQH